MRAVLTRVTSASVVADGCVTGAIGKGFLVLLGVHKDDTEADAGEGGVAQGIGEESHLMVHRHGAQQAQQGREQEDRQEGVFHERVLIGFQGEDRAEDAVDRIHHSASSSSPL